jgi:hypothetical protein
VNATILADARLNRTSICGSGLEGCLETGREKDLRSVGVAGGVESIRMVIRCRPYQLLDDHDTLRHGGRWDGMFRVSYEVSYEVDDRQ